MILGPLRTGVRFSSPRHNESMALVAGRATGVLLATLGTLATQILRHELPVDQIPPRRDILGPGIAVVNIVRMLPYITG